jgi:hypothetical protein
MKGSIFASSGNRRKLRNKFRASYVPYCLVFLVFFSSVLVRTFCS